MNKLYFALYALGVLLFTFFAFGIVYYTGFNMAADWAAARGYLPSIDIPFELICVVMALITMVSSAKSVREIKFDETNPSKSYIQVTLYLFNALLGKWLAVGLLAIACAL